MKVESVFDNYRQLKQELMVMEFQLQNFKGLSEDDAIECLTFAAPATDERVQTSNISNKTGRIAEIYRDYMQRENAEYYNFLFGKYRALKEELDFFDASIKGLPGQEGDIVRDLIAGEMTWDEIATLYHISRTTIARTRRSAVQKISEIFAQREKQKAAFLLS